MMIKTPLCGAVLFVATMTNALAQYPGWQHAGSLHILTTPEGANLPASMSEDGFPLLVRLHRDFFDFSQARPGGDDIRFSTGAGDPLPYQIEQWDAVGGTASIWVRVPTIRGNARQELRMHWGKADAPRASNGTAVFNASNGYLSVWHMNESATDEVGTLVTRDVGTTPAAGMIGLARHFAGQQGFSCGDAISNYPSGSESHSSAAWFRAEKPNGNILAWGNEQAQGKVVMIVASPPHIRMDCYFSGGNVASGSALSMAQWVHVVHTYRKGESRIYVNGALDGTTVTDGSPLNIRSPAKMWIGGWYNNYNFIGDLDEVRISKVVRSADWIRLEYENQKPSQTLVGLLVQPGATFSVAPTEIAVAEAQSAVVTATAGGAQKLYWILKSDGRETVVAVDRLSFTFEAGRVNGDQSHTLLLKAVYPDGVKTKEIPVRVKEDVPEPVFTLKAPKRWDGRETIEIVPVVSNLARMAAKGAGELDYAWTVSDIAVIKECVPGKLVLKRAQNSGVLTVTLTVRNGGAGVTASTTIRVKEPAKDAWVQSVPAGEELPEENQFYARDDRNVGTLHCTGVLRETAEAVFLRLYAGDELVKSVSRKVAASKAYALSVPLKPGLVKYRVEFGARNGDQETVLHRAGNLVCGDAYLINGQSNADATDFGKEDPTFTSDWIRSFGSMAGDPQGARLKLWGNATHRNRQGGKLQIGYWGMELARRLVDDNQIPICILNGAVGGTRVDQHQRNPADPEDVTTIYGRLLWRVRQARLTHGIRGVLWHQGENDQGADGPTGGYGWETYRSYFVDLAAGWKQDFPNLRHYYIFQIWPKSCSMGVDGSDNLLREVQRTLPTCFSNMGIMSTLGIRPPGPAHYPAAGYAEMARLIRPLVEQDNYGKVFAAPVTPPNLKRAYFASDRQDEVVMEFDQPVKWSSALVSEFYLDGEKGKVASGSVSGGTVTLKLTAASAARTLTYLDSKSWSQESLLVGENDIAALTFCNVPILPVKPSR